MKKRCSLEGCEKQVIDIPCSGRNDENEEDEEEVEPQKKRAKTESPARLDTPQIQLPEIADPADDSASLQVYAMI